jgi:cbb3-type cytochrome oxidase subunit 3
VPHSGSALELCQSGNNAGMARRRVIYWAGILSLAVVWWMDPGDDYAACQEAAAAAGQAEWAPDGLSVFPPGYECLYIRGDEVVPLDVGGWVELVAQTAVPVLLLYGLVSFALRMRGRHAPQPAGG